MQSIQYAVEHSKRVVCLVSNDFLRSEYCMAEFRCAWQRCLQLKKHRLIAIKWPDVDINEPNRIELESTGTTDLKMFLSTHKYIEYGANDWWNQMLYALTVNRMGHIRDDEDVQLLEA